MEMPPGDGCRPQLQSLSARNVSPALFAFAHVRACLHCWATHSPQSSSEGLYFLHLKSGRCHTMTIAATTAT
ncbi:hypothetical protein VTN77DRAFT_8058 [Rasamsonia byssochlamydoides]|uniref:uncharacterized protein n=1 Tax=Rasamsonia byssochlamydoides TaxID=89139 RepID=UPI0037449CBF